MSPQFSFDGVRAALRFATPPFHTAPCHGKKLSANKMSANSFARLWRHTVFHNEAALSECMPRKLNFPKTMAHALLAIEKVPMAPGFARSGLHSRSPRARSPQCRGRSATPHTLRKQMLVHMCVCRPRGWITHWGVSIFQTFIVPIFLCRKIVCARAPAP